VADVPRVAGRICLRQTKQSPLVSDLSATDAKLYAGRNFIA
jgi:hypothetical protein